MTEGGTDTDKIEDKKEQTRLGDGRVERIISK